MKRFLSAGLALVLVGGAAACLNLDEKLVSSLGSNYAATQQGLTDLTNGIYAGVRGYNGGDGFTLSGLVDVQYVVASCPYRPKSEGR